MKDLDQIFGRLSRSKFRSGFKLKNKELNYLSEKGNELNDEQEKYILTVIKKWIEKQLPK